MHEPCTEPGARSDANYAALRSRRTAWSLGVKQLAKNEYLTGIGGWLGFLIASLMIFSPLGRLGTIVRQFSRTEKQYPQLLANAQWANYKLAIWLIVSVCVAISIAAGYRLWKVHFSESVRFAIIALWISGPLGGLLYMATEAVVFGIQDMPSTMPEKLRGMAVSICAAAAWTAYLLRSVRVRNTYKTKLSTPPAD